MSGKYQIELGDAGHAHQVVWYADDGSDVIVYRAAGWNEALRVRHTLEIFAPDGPPKKGTAETASGSTTENVH